MTEQLQKHTLWLFKGDFKRISELYPDLSGAHATRMVLRKHIREKEAETERTSKKYENDLINL